MVIIRLFILVLILTISFTLIYIKFMNYMMEHCPNYIGCGLRNKLFGKPRSNRGNYANQESIPIKISRNLENGTSQVANRTRICGLIQYIIQKMPVLKYRYQIYTYAKTESGYSYFVYLFSHIKRIIVRVKSLCQPKTNDTQ